MLRYSLLTAGLMLGASAFAAPAGDLPLMPWPAKVERPTTQGALVLTSQLSVTVSGDVTAGGVSLDNHTHTDSMGGGTSGPS